MSLVDDEPLSRGDLRRILAEEDDGPDGFSEDDEPGYCPSCSGSGEGQYDGTRCHSCHGTGEQR